MRGNSEWERKAIKWKPLDWCLTWKTHQFVSRSCKGIRDRLEPQLPVPNTFTPRPTQSQNYCLNMVPWGHFLPPLLWSCGKLAVYKQWWDNQVLACGASSWPSGVRSCQRTAPCAATTSGSMDAVPCTSTGSLRECVLCSTCPGAS